MYRFLLFALLAVDAMAICNFCKNGLPPSNFNGIVNLGTFGLTCSFYYNINANDPDCALLKSIDAYQSVCGCGSGTVIRINPGPSKVVPIPSKPPVMSPVRNPTKAPVHAPTKPPVNAPTKPPVHAPTKAPTKPPTKAAPVKSPVKAPTKVPTKRPTLRGTPAPNPSTRHYVFNPPV